MDEILNNLEKLSNLLAENNKITIEEFGPISQIIAETEIKVVQLCGVGIELPTDRLKLDWLGNEIEKKYVELDEEEKKLIISGYKMACDLYEQKLQVKR